MRKKIVAGNWKMNVNLQQTQQLLTDLIEEANTYPSDVKVIVAPSFTNLQAAVQQLENVNIDVAAQHMSEYEKGAYTGEVSADMLKSIGLTHVILGHSERRQYFGETNAKLAQKVSIALANKLTVIFCVGEELENRKNNTHFDIVTQQISEGLFHLSPVELNKIIIAYEPVWAIGTGETASPEQAQEMHAHIRNVIAERYTIGVADSVSILYGGSVKPSNADELFTKPDVDGGLIGGAALKADDFSAIVNARSDQKLQQYIGLTFTVAPINPVNEILIAELSELGFDTFVETETGLEAYILEENFDHTILDDLYVFENPDFDVSYTVEQIAQVNWNEEWEKNFNPIKVDDQCLIRAPFHPAEEVPYEIIIEPKMSFGTGHHATTYMMLKHILAEKWEGKKVLDMGCGTGVLAILAYKKGAAAVDAIDIDNWCYVNTLENIARNQCPAISVKEGDTSLINATYDVIIANINRNILLQDMPIYATHLAENGSLFLSGFYEEDLPVIKEKAASLGLTYQTHLEKDKWIGAKFTK